MLLALQVKLARLVPQVKPVLLARLVPQEKLALLEKLVPQVKQAQQVLPVLLAQQALLAPLVKPVPLV